jgi:hypothetical protein
MLYKGVETTLQRTVKWLLKGNDAKSWWDAHTEHAEACLSEMVQMSQPVPDPTMVLGSQPEVDLSRQALVRVVPHVRIMVAAMQKRDRPAALKSGQEALAQLKAAR